MMSQIVSHKAHAATQKDHSSGTVVTNLPALAAIAKALLSGHTNYSTHLVLSNSQDEHHIKLTPTQATLIKKASVVYILDAKAQPDFFRNASRLTDKSVISPLCKPNVCAWQYSAGKERNRDMHVWLDLAIMERMTNTMARDLQKRFPSLSIDSAKHRFIGQLRKSHAIIQKRLSLVSDKSWFTPHGGFLYFAKSYKLQEPLALGPHSHHGHQPTIRKLLSIKKSLLAQNVRCVVVDSPRYPAYVTQIVEERSATILVFPPTGRFTAGRFTAGQDLDFLADLEQFSEELKLCLSH